MNTSKLPQPKVSILMPVKNAGDYLKSCIKSILQQDFSDFELIAIDDHSADDSARILQQFARRDERLRWYAAEGEGIIDALRQAYGLSRGTYITRMDADDEMRRGKIHLLHQALTENGQGAVAIGNVRYFATGKNLGIGYIRYEKWLNRLTNAAENFEEIYKECSVPSPCWMLHRTDLDAIGAFDSPHYPEDYDLAFRMYRAGLQVIPVRDVLHDWRDYMTRTSRTHQHYKDNRFLDLKIHYFLALDHDKKEPLYLYGAGRKGKYLAKLLLKNKIPFVWLCNNDNKIGKNIYGQIMQSAKHWETTSCNAQVIFAVAARNSRKEIEAILPDYLTSFWFC